MHRGIVVATLALALLTAAPSHAAVTNERVPLDRFVFVPCANGGAGEFVHLTGTLRSVFSVTENPSGGFQIRSHFNPQGVSGVGEISGAKYQGTGVTRSNFNLLVGSTSTSVNNFRVIGQGAGNNLLIHSVVHVTVNANGVVTALVDRFSVECK
jgi:hypothetical protein